MNGSAVRIIHQVIRAIYETTSNFSIIVYAPQ